MPKLLRYLNNKNLLHLQKFETLYIYNKAGQNHQPIQCFDLFLSKTHNIYNQNPEVIQIKTTKSYKYPKPISHTFGRNH